MLRVICSPPPKGNAFSPRERKRENLGSMSSRFPKRLRSLGRCLEFYWLEFIWRAELRLKISPWRARPLCGFLRARKLFSASRWLRYIEFHVQIKRPNRQFYQQYTASKNERCFVFSTRISTFYSLPTQRTDFWCNGFMIFRDPDIIIWLSKIAMVVF